MGIRGRPCSRLLPILRPAADPMAPDARPDPAPEASEPADPGRIASGSTLPEHPVSSASDSRQLGSSRKRSGASASASQSGPFASLREGLDRLLVADVFVVLAGAVWFGVAVLLHSRGIEAPLRLFQRLWQPLFTPAIGLLMAAALLSGALGWWQRRGRGEVRGTGS